MATEHDIECMYILKRVTPHLALSLRLRTEGGVQNLKSKKRLSKPQPSHSDRQTDRQTGTKTDIQTGRQRDRQTDKQTDRQTDRQSDRQTG